MQLNLAVTHFPPQNCHKRFLFFLIIELFSICSGQGGDCEKSGTEGGVKVHLGV